MSEINVKTGLYSDYAYSLFSMWSILYTLKTGYRATPYCSTNIKKEYNIKYESDGEIVLNFLKDYNTSSYILYNVGSRVNLDNVYKVMGNWLDYNFSKNPNESFNILCFNIFSRFFKYCHNGTDLESYLDLDLKNLQDIKYSDDELLFNTIDLDIEKNIKIYFGYNTKKKREYLYSFYRKVFDAFQTKKENGIYKISILDIFLLSIIEYSMSISYTVPLKCRNVDIDSALNNDSYIKNLINQVIAIRNLTWGDYQNFHKFLLNRKSLEKKNPEFIKKLIGSQRDPITIEFIENTKTELENIVIESSKNIENLSTEIEKMLDEITEKIIEKFECEYNKSKDKITELVKNTDKLIKGKSGLNERDYINKLFVFDKYSLKESIEDIKRSL